MSKKPPSIKGVVLHTVAEYDEYGYLISSLEASRPEVRLDKPRISLDKLKKVCAEYMKTEPPAPIMPQYTISG